MSKLSLTSGPLADGRFEQRHVKDVIDVKPPVADGCLEQPHVKDVIDVKRGRLWVDEGRHGVVN